MTRFGLSDNHINFIKDILKKYLSSGASYYADFNIKFYVFGSRANNSYREYSDIDLALDDNGKIIPSDVIAKIKADFDNSTLPYEVDIVDLNAISDIFKKSIEASLIEL